MISSVEVAELLSLAERTASYINIANNQNNHRDRLLILNHALSEADNLQEKLSYVVDDITMDIDNGAA